MLLLFWTGVYDGVGVIPAVGTAVGSGVRITEGSGVVTCTGLLIGNGSIRYEGIGSIISVAALIGQADVITPAATYLFTLALQDGAVYQFVAEGSPLDAEYVAGESPSRAEYTHQVPGRIIP